MGATISAECVCDAGDKATEARLSLVPCEFGTLKKDESPVNNKPRLTSEDLLKKPVDENTTPEARMQAVRSNPEHVEGVVSRLEPVRTPTATEAGEDSAADAAACRLAAAVEEQKPTPGHVERGSPRLEPVQAADAGPVIPAGRAAGETATSDAACKTADAVEEESSTRAPTPEVSGGLPEGQVVEQAASQTKVTAAEPTQPDAAASARTNAPKRAASKAAPPKASSGERRATTRHAPSRASTVQTRSASKDKAASKGVRPTGSKDTPPAAAPQPKQPPKAGAPAATANAVPAGKAGAAAGIRPKAAVAAKQTPAPVVAAASVPAPDPPGSEILPGKLWWIASQDCREADNVFSPDIDMRGREQEAWICFLNEKPVRFCRFSVPHYTMASYHDDGPPALDQIVEACHILDEALSNNRRAVVYCPAGEQFDARRRFSVFFVAAYQVLVHNMHPMEVAMSWEPETYRRAVDFPAHSWAPKKKPPPPRNLGLEECLEALEFAKNKGWLDVSQFDVMNFKQLFLRWDASWIVPGELMLMADPVSTIDDPDPCTSKCLTSKSAKAVEDAEHAFTTLFNSCGVGLLVRTNMENEPGLRVSYKAKELAPYNISHVDCPVNDTQGGLPGIAVLKRVIDASDCFLADGGRAISIHCKAGFGRSAVCALTLLIRRHKMPGTHAMAWCRICRPGCINTMEQVGFLRKLRSERDVEQLFAASKDSANKSRRSFFFG